MKPLWLCLLAGCAFSMPPDRTITGVLAKVQHDDRYEAPCTITQRIRDKSACEFPPICCSYRATVVDAGGQRTEFWAFWPRQAPGLLGLVPLWATATFRLHAHYLVLPQTCTIFGCQENLEYALDADTDVRP